MCVTLRNTRYLFRLNDYFFFIIIIAIQCTEDREFHQSSRVLVMRYFICFVCVCVSAIDTVYTGTSAARI